MKKLFAIPLLMFFVFACDSTTSVEEERDAAREFFDEAEAAEYETVFQTVDESTSGNTNFEESDEIIFESEEEFRDFWVELNENLPPAADEVDVPDVPVIDFDTKKVIAVLMGTQNTGGYFTTIEEVGVLEGVTGIRVLETEPGENCVTTQVLTMPYHIITVSNELPDEYEFFIERIVLNCPEDDD